MADIVVDARDVSERSWCDKPYIYHGDDAKIQCTLDTRGWEISRRVYNLLAKAPTLMGCGGGSTRKKVYQDGRCRLLMPIEYERLMTVPDGYTAGVTDTHRCDVLGNGFTVDVIAHILSYIEGGVGDDRLA